LADLTTQAEALLQRAGLGEKAQSPNTGKKHLTQDQIAKILRLSDEGLTQVQIADAIGVDNSTICRTLANFQDTTDLASRRFKASAIQTAERLIAIAEKSADEDAVIKAAKVGLEVAGLTGQRVTGAGPIAIQVNVGMPGQPAGPDPLMVNISSKDAR